MLRSTQRIPLPRSELKVLVLLSFVCQYATERRERTTHETPNENISTKVDSSGLFDGVIEYDRDMTMADRDGLDRDRLD